MIKATSFLTFEILKFSDLAANTAVNRNHGDDAAWDEVVWHLKHLWTW